MAANDTKRQKQGFNIKTGSLAPETTIGLAGMLNNQGLGQASYTVTRLFLMYVNMVTSYFNEVNDFRCTQ